MITTNNFSGNHFTLQEMKEISALIYKIDELVRPKMVTLSDAEKGKLNQSSKSKRLFVSKVVDYKLRQSELSSKNVDWDYFNLIFADKTFLKSSILCLQNILLQMDNIRSVYDNENFKASLADFENTREAAEANKSRYEEKYNELKLLFSEIK